jgi:branched-chain amino acid aminotransferase
MFLLSSKLATFAPIKNAEHMATSIAITKSPTSKINDVDFNNLLFGTVFTDHMFYCDFIDGQWQQPQITPYQAMTFDPAARVFHYGQAVFEGMKAYKDDTGKIFLFRPDQNFNRINKSSARLAMPEFPEDFFFEGLNQLIKLDSAWIKPGIGNSLYIRPFVIATEPAISASPAKQYRFMIILSPAKAYYAGKVRVYLPRNLVAPPMVASVLQKQPVTMRHNFTPQVWHRKKATSK